MNQYSFILQFGNIVAISFIAFALYVILQLKRVCSNEWKNINSVAKWTISASGSKFRENRLLNAIPRFYIKAFTRIGNIPFNHKTHFEH